MGKKVSLNKIIATVLTAYALPFLSEQQYDKLTLLCKHVFVVTHSIHK